MKIQRMLEEKAREQEKKKVGDSILPRLTIARQFCAVSNDSRGLKQDGARAKDIYKGRDRIAQNMDIDYWQSN